MKRNVAVVVLVISLLTLWTINSHAIGIGFYGGGGAGSQAWEIEEDYDTSSKDTDSAQGEFGIILDTAVAEDTLFNYRLGLGYERITYTDERDMELAMNLFVMDNIFGFGVVRTEAIRFWVGPELRIFGGAGDSDYGDTVSMVGGGIGPSVGVNIHAGPTVSFTISASGLYSFGTGENEDNAGRTYGSIDGFQAYVRAGVLFRIGDKYRK